MSTINEDLRDLRLKKEVQNLLLQDRAILAIETCSDEYESEDDCSYNYNDEKAYVCDYDTIYVCLYEELEDYRTSKQAKKKNTTNSWNNLLVVMPGGTITNMQNAPSRISKEATKLTTDNEKLKIIKIKDLKGFSIEFNGEESVKLKTNNITRSHVPEVNAAKVGPEQSNKQKLSKKKLKKQRQKEKKKRKESKEKDQEEEAEEENDDVIAGADEEPEDVINKDKSRSESKAESLESAQDEVDDQESEDINQASVDIDLSDEMASSAFVSNALKKKKKNILIKKEEKAVKTSDLTKANKKAVVSVELKPVEKKTALPSKPKASVQPSVDPDFDFTVKKIKRPKASGNEYQEAVALGKEAYKLIMSDQLSEAIQFLSEAIRYNSYDLRHFLNRSFCYLRLGAYNLALKDAQVVIKYTNEREELVKAKFRSGQALCGLQNFEEAEKQLNEAYNFSQVDLHIHRELMRVRILQLLYIGFRERDILDAFKERSSVADVVSILTEKTSVDKDDDYSYGNECYVDDIYNSDDEENPSFTRMLSNMLKYQPGVPKKVPVVPPSPLKIVNPIQQTATGPYRNPVVTEAKKIINTVLPKPVVPNKSLVNDKAIWVGNTTPEVTDNMLRKKFTRYGKIISIYRKPNEAYTFINFESAKAVTALLTSIAKTQSVEVEGHKLLVKAATRTK